MKNLSLLIFTGLFPFLLSAQNCAVKGRLVDSTHQSLSNATVSVLQKKDSSLVSYTLSDAKGSFEIKNLSPGEFLLFASLTGFEVYTGSFITTPDKTVADLGVIIMRPEYKTLTTVVVSDASPVRLNGDTISFKANAFNT